MKNINKLRFLLPVAILALTVWSCDENLDPAPVVSTEGYPVATFTASATTVNEKDGVFSIKITTDKAIGRGITFSAEQTGGTAVLHDDYDIVEAIVAPFSKEATVKVKFYGDALKENDKTLQLKITTPSLANKYLLNPTTTLPSYTVTIKNYVSTDLDMVFNYNKSFTDGTTAKTLCGISYDVDFYVLDDKLVDTGNYQAASGNCPEALTVSPAKFKNGTYHIYHDLYDNKALPTLNTPEFTVPIVVDYSRAGVVAGKFNQEAAFAFSSKAAKSYDYVISIVVSNGVYTLVDSKKSIIANAKTANKILAAIEHARANNKK
jgi:hypothetical protein